MDKLVDNSTRYRILSFMDVYSDYNQIPMYELNWEKTTFMTEQANYQYNVMFFGLKTQEQCEGNRDRKHNIIQNS